MARSFDEVLDARAAAIERDRARVARGELPEGIIPTGIREFDRRAGVKRRVLTIYGASTGEGKSAWKLHLATAAAKAGLSVTVVDMEDPEERTADRALSSETGINNARMEALDLTDSEVERISAAALSAGGWAKRVRYEAGLVAADEVRELMEDCDSDLLLLDYLQGLPDGEEGLERAIARLCWDLNKWAQDRGAAAVALSQVKPSVEERGLRAQESAQRRNPGGPANVEGFRPFGPSDLAWCTAAGQRCKELGFMFRPGRYRRRFGEDVQDDVVEFTFPKRNFGAEAKVRVGWDPKQARFFDLPSKEK